MDGTYAIVSYSNGQNKQKEWILGPNRRGNMTEESSFGTPQVEEVDSERTVTVIRPYVFDGTFDFTDFMNAKDKSLKLIAAFGEEGDTTFKEKHNTYYQGEIITSCTRSGESTPSPVSVPPGPSPSSNANNIKYLFGLIITIILSIAL